MQLMATFSEARSIHDTIAANGLPKSSRQHHSRGGPQREVVEADPVKASWSTGLHTALTLHAQRFLLCTYLPSSIGLSGNRNALTGM